ncbi:alpha/beta fold hydrolase [Kitasatospora sp. NPDC059973]|uniref:alpha/beta fold hydrolase n=1 Tax=Kitasatospora sp. NPDC059973 TaxID=3347020 RepID=UPI0036CF2273
MSICAASTAPAAFAAGSDRPGRPAPVIPTITPGTHTTCTELKRVQAGVLDIGYAEAGPKHEPVVICLHGRPYHIQRVIVPYLRGHGTTHFLSPTTVRTGQQSAITLDVIALMGALKIHKAVLAGFDWGSRAAGTISTLWPERVKALVAASGYLIVDIPSQQNPLPTKTEHTWWYQYYFATEGAASPWRPSSTGTTCADWCGRRALPPATGRPRGRPNGGCRQHRGMLGSRFTERALPSAYPAKT